VCGGGLDSQPTLMTAHIALVDSTPLSRIAAHSVSDRSRALRSRLQPLGSYLIRITRPHGSQPTRITATRSLGSIGSPLGLQPIPITAYSDCSPLGSQPLGLQPTRIAATRIIAHSDHSPLGSQPTRIAATRIYRQPTWIAPIIPITAHSDRSPLRSRLQPDSDHTQPIRITAHSDHSPSPHCGWLVLGRAGAGDEAVVLACQACVPSAWIYFSVSC
jgi:hypothetical protein